MLGNNEPITQVKTSEWTEVIRSHARMLTALEYLKRVYEEAHRDEYTNILLEDIEKTLNIADIDREIDLIR